MKAPPTVPFRLWFLLLLALCLPAFAAEYFVAPQGDDAHAGTSREAAFRTIQRGVDALAPGDTLTIAPGEYFGSVARKGLGAKGAVTTIRAAVPGSVVVRGDVRAPALQPVAGEPRVFVADFDQAVEGVNEVTTLTPLAPLPNAADVALRPGGYFYDAAAKKLYLSTSDFKPASAHAYTVGLAGENGIFLDKPVGVVIEGLAVTGFNTSKEVPYSPGNYNVWGMLLFDPADCVVRYCTAYLNGGGIAVNSRSPEGSNNVIEYSTGYGNTAPFSNSGGNIVIFAPKDGVIRHCLAYLSGNNGLRLYGQGMQGANAIEDSLAWGNGGADLFIKGGGTLGTGRRSVAVGAGHMARLENAFVGMKNIYLSPEKWPADSLRLEGRKIDWNTEFADPLNFDFRLQATSQLRGTGAGGADPGAHPYRPVVFFVKPGGNDAADGLSLEHAWGTLSRALRDLPEGATLYLEPGTYPGEAVLNAANRSIALRGRGKGEVRIAGTLTIRDGRGVALERLVLEQPLTVEGGTGLRRRNCTLRGAPVGLQLQGTAGARIEHCAFTGATQSAIRVAGGASGLHLSSNVFDNRKAEMLQFTAKATAPAPGWLDKVKSLFGGAKPKAAPTAYPVVYSDYNVTTRKPDAAPGHEAHSTVLESLETGLAAYGALGKPAGPYRDELREGVSMSKPQVHSVSATTANIEWLVNDNLICQLAWGETPECTNTADFAVSNGYGSYSLVGLKPATTYYFQIRGLGHPHRQSAPAGPAVCAEPEFDVISFTTAAAPAEPKETYVATDGDDTRDGLTRATAWRSVATAAGRVGPGDTVWVAGGRDDERVRVRASGEKGAPITFRSLPGERVEFGSGGKLLEESWVINGKSHIRVDGFYFSQFRMVGGNHVSPRVFSLMDSHDVVISRCFSDSRGSGYGTGFATVRGGSDVTISNCVAISGFNTLGLNGCENFRMEHSVIVVPMIQASIATGRKELITFENNIFTCNSAYKKTIWLHEWKGNIVDRGNAYFPRVPDDEKKLFWILSFVENGKDLGHTRMGLEEYNRRVRETGSLVADPQFAGLRGKTAKSGYQPDAAIQSGKFDFPDFYSTNPEIVRRGIGLEPARFADFHFQKGKSAAAAR